jgi:uncharacterized membrane-anchored protein
VTQQPTFARKSRLGIREHPLRDDLLAEVHARPFDVLSPPADLVHLVMYSGTERRDDEHAHLLRLSRRLGLPDPARESNHCVMDGHGIRIRWERHTEFATITFAVPGDTDSPFRGRALERVPMEWLSGLPGELISATELAMVNTEVDPGRWFESEGSTAACLCAGGAAEVWTDFRAGADGFVRFLVRDHHLTQAQAGRLVKRLLEIETYRLMALLALPLARELAPDIARMETRLGELTEQLADVAGLPSERGLLDELSRLSAEVERQMAQSNFRFGATQAYGALVRRRIRALRESRIEGHSTLAEFMERRFAPAMDTCEHVRDRLDRLARRLSRAANLLRTRVDVALEAQNRDLLETMNARVRLQLRLQQTVEGLSVIILGYYAVGLLAYGLKGLKAVGVDIPVDLLTGLSIPVVLTAVGFGVHIIRRRVASAEPNDPA